MKRWASLALLLLACATTREKGAGLLVPAGPAGITDTASRPKKLALLVGITDFEDARFGPLKYASADAIALGEALEGFEVRTLTTGEETSRAAVLEALEALARDVKDPRTTVLLYFSSHGSLAQKPGGALERVLVTRDSRLDLLAQTGIPIDDLLAAVERIPSKRKAVVLALCHSGKGKSILPDALAQSLAQNKAPLLPPLESRSEATIVLTACAFGETARESDELGHDVYTSFLLTALKEADMDGDGAVTASEAHDFARERTYRYTGGQQRPTSESEVLGKDPIVLRGEPNRRGRPVVYSYAASSEGLALLINGAKKGVLPGGIALEAGDSVLTLTEGEGGATLYSGHVQLHDGERIDLTELLPEKRAFWASAGATTMVPFDAAVRDAFLPATFGVGARLGLERWPWRHSWVELWFASMWGAGSAPGFDERLLFTINTQRGGLSGGVTFSPTARLRIDAGASGGVIWLEREFHRPGYASREGALGGSASLRGALRPRLLEWLQLSLNVETGALFAALGTSSVHPFFAASLEGGVRW